VPVVATGAGCAVRLCCRDHEPAHFHAVAPDGAEAQVRITDAVVIKGDLPAPQRRAVLARASAWQDALALVWLQCRQTQDPGRIE